MSTIKTITSAVTAAVLVTGIGLAWAQAEDQSQSTNSTTAAAAPGISEQTPADPNAAPLTDNAAAMPQQGAVTNPPAVDGTTPAPLSSDANSQAPLSTTASTTPSYEPAPRADRN
jgi:hypothetical protein